MAAAAAPPAAVEPTIDFNPITDTLIVGSCMRNSADVEKAHKAGAVAIFSVQDDDDLRDQKIDLPAVLAACEAHGVKHVRVGCAASDAALRANLPAVAVALQRTIAGAAGGPVYVHCNGGKTRASTVLAAYLYWLGGMQFGEAVDLIQTKRSCKLKQAPVLAATGDLLGAEEGKAELSGVEHAAIEAKLAAL